MSSNWCVLESKQTHRAVVDVEMLILVMKNLHEPVEVVVDGKDVGLRGRKVAKFTMEMLNPVRHEAEVDWDTLRLKRNVSLYYLLYWIAGYVVRPLRSLLCQHLLTGWELASAPLSSRHANKIWLAFLIQTLITFNIFYPIIHIYSMWGDKNIEYRKSSMSLIKINSYPVLFNRNYWKFLLRNFEFFRQTFSEFPWCWGSRRCRFVRERNRPIVLTVKRAEEEEIPVTELYVCHLDQKVSTKCKRWYWIFLVIWNMNWAHI